MNILESRRSPTIGSFPPNSKLSPETWLIDRSRYQRGPLTQSFHRAVPALKFLNWRIEEVERGRCVTRLPLSVESSNQYITQQAALMLLAADYTGGIALSTLFVGTPVVGFEEIHDDSGAYLWGATASIKWLRPSTADIVCTATIPPSRWERILTTFDAGDEVREQVRIKMFNDDRIVAVSHFDYWARNARSLRASGGTLAGTHHMLTHKLNTSAKLIAGLRSWIPGTDQSALLDPFAARAAGAQGESMARKFSLDAPQLGSLVHARTLACDEALQAFAARHQKFRVVNIGVGFDARPWRMSGLGDATFIELDLPVMLRERAVSLPAVEASKYQIIRRPFDILQDDLRAALAEFTNGAAHPTFFIWEGGSMYFDTPVGDALLRKIRHSMPEGSEFWMDYVSRDAVEGRTGLSEVESFMYNMRVIGEPFVRGFDDPRKELAACGLDAYSAESAAARFNTNDPVCKHYGFVRCRPMV